MTWITATAEERHAQLGLFILGAGGMGGIAGSKGPGIGLPEKESHDLIDRALREGFKVIDTADIYAGGESERIVGTWNQAHPDADVLIQSKTGATAEGANLSPARVAAQLEHSIAVLGRVDLYIAHQVDPNTPWSDSLPVFAGAVQDGTIRAYGLSNVTGETLTAALETADRLGIPRPEIIQNSYSLIVRSDDDDVLPIVKAEGLAYTPYSPLATGVLAGRYSNGETPTAGSRASIASRANSYLDDDEVMAKVRRFDALAAEQGVSSAGLALAWLLNHPIVTAPIVAPSKESQWTGIHEALQLQWTAELGQQLDDIFS